MTASPTTRGTPTPSATPKASATTKPSPRPLPCNPGNGAPQPRVGCPDPHPESGWLTVTGDRVVLAPLRTYVDDAEGRAYAQEHGLGFPFLDDYYDAAAGPPATVVLDRQTVCSGITIDSSSPFGDHVVPCRDVLAAARVTPMLPVVVWRKDGSVFQLSELYRP